MRICIVGAGAIGGLIASRLASSPTSLGDDRLGRSSSANVTLLARGATLAALHREGLEVESPDGHLKLQIQASDDAQALGPQDLVIIAVKAPALLALAPTLKPLLTADTIVMPAMNGVPWWFCMGQPGFEMPFQCMDPQGLLARALPLHHVLGCVVHISASTAQPGVIRHKMGRGLIVGEPAGGASDRAQRIVDCLMHAGFDATLSTDIRRDIWYKLWGNLTTNPTSAITGATVDQLLGDPLLRAFMSQAMKEAADLGARIGCRIDQSPEDRHQITAKLGAFKTSMLQDAEAGRPIELDAIVTVVHEIGRRVGVPTPGIDALLGLTRVFARQRSLYA